MKNFSNATIAMILVLTLFTIQSSSAYENSNFDYSIDFPSGWKIQENSYAPRGSSVVIASNGSAYVNVLVIDKLSFNESSIEESSIEDLPIPSIENVLSTSQLLYTKQRTVNGLNGVENAIIFSYGGNQLQAISFYLFQQNKSYHIACIAEQSDFSNLEASFQKCIDSFTITSFVSPSTNPFIESNDYSTALLIGITCVVVISLISIVFIVTKRRKERDQDRNLVPTDSPL